MTAKYLATEVVQSSGNPTLDRRAEAIARTAGPFGAFSAAMRRQADQILVVSRFKFTRDETLEAKVSYLAMKALLRWLVLCAVAALSLQLYFVGRIATMAVVAPQSTSFERSEAWRIANRKRRTSLAPRVGGLRQISDNLKRAVIASEDDGFSQHDGVDWEALEKAWAKNAKAEQKAEQRASQGKPRPSPPKLSAAPPLPSNWPRTCFSPANARCCAKAKSLC